MNNSIPNTNKVQIMKSFQLKLFSMIDPFFLVKSLPLLNFLPDFHKP